MRNRSSASYAKRAVLLVPIVWLSNTVAASASVSKEPDYLLPWATIAQEVRQGAHFCSWTVGEQARAGNETADLIAEANYAHVPNQPLPVRLTKLSAKSTTAESVDVNIARWQNNKWRPFAGEKAHFDGEQVTVANAFKDEGFFRLRFTANGPDGAASAVERFVIVCVNWKKDILSFCRGAKDALESNPDPQLVFSSLAVSHFDHVMEAVSTSTLLSERILKALADAVRSKKAFDSGQCPDFVVGLNKIRLRRFEGADPVQFAVFIPENYDGSRPWPLYVYPDAKNFYRASNYSQRSGLIDMWWEVSDWIEFEWKDYEFILNVLGSKLNLNADRFYLYGHCGNGIPAMALALNYPDRWAECSTLLGNSYRHLAGNALNLPFIFIAGQLQEGAISGYSEFAVKCFEYYGCRHFKCGRENQVVLTRGSSLPETVRENSPKRVLYTIESLANPRAYWVKILGRKDENFAATIDAQVEGQRVIVKTKNIDAYCLDLVQAPLDSNIGVEIVENDRSLGKVNTNVFTSRPEAYANAAHLKNERLHGPIGAAFTDPFVVVWGAKSSDTQLVDASREAALSLANGAPCFADSNLPKRFLESHNLILVGRPESNGWFARICEALPVQISEGQIIADDRRYTGCDMGFILIYPNPLNPHRYVAVFGATSSRAMAGICNAYSAIQSMTRSSDIAQYSEVAVFELSENGEIKWHLLEKFNTMWQWHPAWKEVVAATNKQRPRWQWRQWVAGTLRLELDADVAICNDPFRFPYSALDGDITYRDLFNAFRNDWIVKVSLSGKNLRNILTAVMSGGSKEQVGEVTIDGVSFAGAGSNEEATSLAVSAIENDKFYTVAFSYNLLNGERLGIVLRDYEIVGEGYLVGLVADHLRKNGHLDLDARLDSLRLRMF